MMRWRLCRFGFLATQPGNTAIALALGACATVLAAATTAEAQPCLSGNPADWPPPARPYFMIIADTSGSMAACTNPETIWPEDCPSNAVNNSCGWLPTRANDAKCALRQTVAAFAGEVNFGLATFSAYLSGCPSACNYAYSGTYLYGYRGCSFSGDQCSGARIVVPMSLDITPPSATNVTQLNAFLNNVCSDQQELFAFGGTPLGGALNDVRTYLQSSFGGHTSPLTASDPTCRSLNVILLTDGGETCNGNPVAAAETLHDGFTKDGIFRRIYTHVIAFNIDEQDDQEILDNTHKMGQCGALTGSCADPLHAIPANNEATLASALASIIGSAIKPEVCNNGDDNCNGCVDEGYKHYCNRGKTASTSPTHIGQCCSAARATCLANYANSITVAPPDGNPWWLPCYTPPAAQNSQPLQESANWLCNDPKEACDNVDNNCDGTTPNASTIDETWNKCGSPLHCPRTEVCNGQDDNCNGLVDEIGCTQCVPSAELCDGCDNDCNGIADDGITPLTCGVATPPNCSGKISCGDPQVVAQPGACIGGSAKSRWGTCVTSPQTEVCDGIDNDCDGQIDDNIPPVACGVPGSANLVYQDVNPLSQCKRGTQPCNGACSGWIGPSTEICDGKDNDCDGLVDGNDPSLVGVAQPCDGVCGKGTTACVSGVLVCRSKLQPQPEQCDGLDNDCNGVVDDGVLLDAPPAAQRPCWSLPASNCSPACTYVGATTASWCAPPGADCHLLGSLASPPCTLGALACSGGAWKCIGGQPPETEVCDNIDNNCNGTKDDGLASAPCGTDEGECEPGQMVCIQGQLQCVNAKGPQPEICDGKDNDCDGQIDNGIALGMPCTPEYDTGTFPGVRDKGQCRPGVNECGPNHEVICVGGVGPTAEVCDGLDNDCDGAVDEPGAPPDGVNGTADPDDPARILGQTCGDSEGACEPGKWACVNAKFACEGGLPPQTEVCDCIDNDCDGQTDEDPEPGSGKPELCSEGKACVFFQGGCQCAALCGGGEYPCPSGGFDCEAVNYSSTGESAGARCVIDGCGDCSTMTVMQSDGQLECAPAGTVGSDGAVPPVCICKLNGCHAPCLGVQCEPPQVCADLGPRAGRCVEYNCWNFPCAVGQACNLGSCVDSPCKADSCAADQACKPSADFSSFTCVASCAKVTCAPDQACVNGECLVTGCAQPCPDGQVCAGEDAGGCVPSKCTEDSCPNGAYCDPLTEACGNDPCAGVACPTGQRCEAGECQTAPDGGTGGSGTGGTDGGTSGGTGGGTGGSVTPDADATPQRPKGNWALPTGGGGFSCQTGVGLSGARAGAMLGWLGLTLLLARRRRRVSLDAKSPRDGSDGGWR